MSSRIRIVFPLIVDLAMEASVCLLARHALILRCSALAGKGTRELVDGGWSCVIACALGGLEYGLGVVASLFGIFNIVGAFFFLSWFVAKLISASSIQGVWQSSVSEIAITVSYFGGAYSST